MDELIARYGYLAVLVGTFLEGETILVLGGFAARHGLLWLPGVMLAAFLGSLASDQLFFFLGRTRGEAWLARRPKWKPGVDRVRALVQTYNTALILSFRFLYGLRNVTPFALGLTSVPALRFALLNTVGAAVWAVAVALLGWFVGSAAKRLIGDVERYELRVAIGIVAVGVALWLWRTQRTRATPASPSGTP